MELSGTLGQFPLRELLMLMQDSMMCGDLELQARYGTAIISSQDGLIRHAEYMNKIGFEALWLIFEEPTSTTFTIRAKRELPNQSLIGDAKLLCDEGEARAKNWQSIRSLIPNNKVIPTVLYHMHPIRPLDSFDKSVAQAINGKRNLRELAQELVLEEIDVARSLVRLLDAGVVKIHAPNQESAPPITNDLPKGGLFKRVNSRQ